MRQPSFVQGRGFTRREMLSNVSTGFGMMALSGLMSQRAFGGPVSPAAKPYTRRKVKSVIFCYMSGGVSQVDSFDPKPRLKQLAGKPMPVTIKRTQFNDNGDIFPSPFEFKPRGQSGIQISSMFPKIAEWCPDELAVIRSMTSAVNEHAQGNYAMHTGFPFISKLKTTC